MTLLRRTLLLLTALAMLASSTAYAAHQHRSDVQMGQVSAEHCDLCLQWQRVAGPTVIAPQDSPAPAYRRLAAPQGQPQVQGRTPRRAHAPRGPPLQT